MPVRGRRSSPRLMELDVPDLVFIVLTLAIFALLGLVAKGAERL
ncbi:hypothetical protein BH10ACT8_BH10ACT8_18710 [soil metagenome]